MGGLAQHAQPSLDRNQQVTAFWSEIGRRVKSLGLDWKHVKVYQDALPATTPEIIQKIVAEVSSQNFELLRWMISQGAELVGTESPGLLQEEYGHLRAVLMASTPERKAQARQAYAARATSLLDERDRFVARRIAATLPQEGIGILFLGEAHHATRYLPPDIKVRRLPPSDVPPCEDPSPTPNDAPVGL